MTEGKDRRDAADGTSSAIPAGFCAIVGETLTGAGWASDGPQRWHRTKRVGRTQVSEAVAIEIERSGSAPQLTGAYHYRIDTNSDYGVLYNQQEQLPAVPLSAADPTQLAASVLAFSGRERRLLAPRAAWMVGDAWPRLRELALQPGWQNPIASPRWSVRWTADGDEWVVTTLDPNIAGEHPLLRYERYRGAEPAAAPVASGALPLDPLADVGGTFAEFVALIGAPTACS